MELNKWREKLLDLGRGNRLINFKDSKSGTIDIILPDSEKVFAYLLSGNPIEIYDPDPMIKSLFASVEQTDVAKLIAAIQPKLKTRQVVMVKDGLSSQTILREIVSKSRSSILEKGINVLYVAFGFLKWHETENGREENLSPFILVPVTIKRESRVKPYFMQLYDDEIIINPTLSYKLKRDYGIDLSPLAADQSANDYYRSVQEMLSPLKWEYVDAVKVGLFAFFKLNMYMDLKDNEKTILENENIRTLLGKTSDSNPESSKDEVNVSSNQNRPPLHNVVDADSSQIDAIWQVKDGHSIVLQGPPGTGKSQTITNIISECLYDGKKVLFVSEKLAALEVVFQNLHKAGLSDFCLELHSSKTNKKAVISELNRVLKLDRISVTAQAEEELDQWMDARKSLDEYARVLHQKVPKIDQSLYELLSAVAGMDTVPKTKYIIPKIEEKNGDFLRKAESLLTRYADFAELFGADYQKSEWNGLRSSDRSYEFHEHFLSILSQASEGVSQYLVLAERLRNDDQEEITSLEEIQKKGKMRAFIAHSQYINAEAFQNGSQKTYLAAAKRLKDLSDDLTIWNGELDSSFRVELKSLDFQPYYNRFITRYSTLFRILMPSYKKDCLSLSLFAKNPNKKRHYKHWMQVLSLLERIRLARLEYEKNVMVLAPLLGEKPSDFGTDWQRLVTELSDLSDLCKEIVDPSLGKRPLSWFEEKKRHQAMANAIATVSETYKKALSALQECFDESLFSLMETNPKAVFQRLTLLLNHVERLDAWITLQDLLRDIEKNGIQSYLHIAIQEGISSSQLAPAFVKLFDTQWAYQILNQEWALSDLPRRVHDKIVADFQTKDRLKLKISRVQIAEKMSLIRPETDILSPGSFTSILVRENEKKRNLRPVRVLLHDLSTLVLTLKPCFLMSPLSVSTYLDSDSIHFDVVLFDEASQIFPQDAIGAIYRAKQVVIVGDSKQMPPSSFFEAGVAYNEFGEEDDYTDDIEDYESILDIASTRFKENRLKWHYRSRVEDLITFSNQNFYDHELITFPSARKKAKGFGIDFHYIEQGIFDRSSKTNPKEAEYVAKLVFEHFREYPERSLGVVAFSISQQEEIDTIITKMREKNDPYEAFFKEDRKEPFFIKNLETVQGDERDTILFSIAYSYDASGKFYHNFGPLNQEGGERRLNVAITRAKQNVCVVSSIKSIDIDPKKTQARGVMLLRDYLAYAENGTMVQKKNATIDENIEPDRHFEEAVAAFLQEEGFIVTQHIGTSESKVDLAVRHPDRDIDVLAIECDGFTYHNGRNTRDRDRLRQEVLEKMGWRFYRIWSPDWFRNPKDEKERLLAAVTKAIADYDLDQTNPITPEPGTLPFTSASITEPQLVTKSNSDATPPFPLYFPTDMSVILPQYYAKYCDFDFLFYSILESEAPISEERLLKMICGIYQREKVTSVVRTLFHSQVEKLRVKEYLFRDGFYHLEYRSVYPLRIPKTKAESRSVAEICTEELAGGFLEIIRQNISVNTEGLFKSAMNYLGFVRNTDEIQSVFEQILQYLIRLHLVSQKMDAITLVGKR